MNKYEFSIDILNNKKESIAKLKSLLSSTNDDTDYLFITKAVSRLEKKELIPFMQNKTDTFKNLITGIAISRIEICNNAEIISNSIFNAFINQLKKNIKLEYDKQGDKYTNLHIDKNPLNMFMLANICEELVDIAYCHRIPIDLTKYGFIPTRDDDLVARLQLKVSLANLPRKEEYEVLFKIVTQKWVPQGKNSGAVQLCLFQKAYFETMLKSYAEQTMIPSIKSGDHPSCIGQIPLFIACLNDSESLKSLKKYKKIFESNLKNYKDEKQLHILGYQIKKVNLFIYKNEMKQPVIATNPYY